MIYSLIDIQSRSNLFPKSLETGLSALDQVLCHGIGKGLVTEFCGQIGSGRSSTLLHIASVNLENPLVHIIFVDFKRDLYLDRLEPFIRKLPWGCIANLEEDVFPRVTFVRLTTVQELFDFLEVRLEKEIIVIRSKSPESIILLLIDNVALPFKWWIELQRGDMILAIKRIASQLRLVTCEFNLYTIVTNSMTKKLDIDKSTRRLVREYHVPALGKPWLDAIDTRIIFEKCPDGILARPSYCWCGKMPEITNVCFKIP